MDENRRNLLAQFIASELERKRYNVVDADQEPQVCFSQHYVAATINDIVADFEYQH